MMEERSMVAESKIKKLQTENEALRLHLKLALESIKNPIPPVVVKADRELDDEDKENASEYGDDDDQYDSESTAYNDEYEYELQEEMQQYLQDMGNLRKLMKTDLTRFKDGENVRMPLGKKPNF
jgi:LPS O-antigen subunit length determinant protein (WzzB/FepE family)